METKVKTAQDRNKGNLDGTGRCIPKFHQGQRVFDHKPPAQGPESATMANALLEESIVQNLRAVQAHISYARYRHSGQKLYTTYSNCATGTLVSGTVRYYNQTYRYWGIPGMEYERNENEADHNIGMQDANIARVRTEPTNDALKGENSQ